MTNKAAAVMSPGYPFNLVCPRCKGEVKLGERSLDCGCCRASFDIRDGIPDLIVGGRFEDEENAELFAHEEATCTFTTENYIAPLLERLFAGYARTPRVLSLGCGLGTDVDLLREAGYDVAGIDCGNRSTAWKRRLHKDRLYLANGMYLPFEDQTFDLVYCGCVFPHVGVEGDTNRVLQDYAEQRSRIAREMRRVLKTGGHVMVSSPNRLFPFDLFHGRSPGKQMWPRWNPPSSPFLLSASDYRSMFEKAGCGAGTLLPTDNYWGFLRRNQSLAGKLTALPVKMAFSLSSRPLGRILRGSPMLPWLVMQFRRLEGGA